MKANILNKILFLAGISAAVFILGFFGMFARKAEAAVLPVTGFAYSDNIGWINFDPLKNVNYDVMYDDVSGQLSGYAWSDHIGWIYFGPDISGKISSSTAPSTPRYWARVINGNVFGWAIAYRAIPDTSDANAQDSQTLGGWDGWIRMRGVADNGSSYGVSVNLNINSNTYGHFSGWAWGGDVVGWVSFNCSNTQNECASSDYRVKIGPSDPRVDVTANGEQDVDIVTGNGIDCRSDCSQQYAPGTVVTLTASNVADNINISRRFRRWSVGNQPDGSADITCDVSSGANVCEFIMPSYNVRITANFNKRLTIQMRGGGTGIVNVLNNGNNGSACNKSQNTTCIRWFPYDNQINLSATGSDFTGWANDCSGTGSCSFINLNSDKLVTANFDGVSESDFNLFADPPQIKITIINNKDVAPASSIIKVDAQGDFDEEVTLSVDSIRDASGEDVMSQFDFNLSDTVLTYGEYLGNIGSKLDVSVNASNLSAIQAGGYVVTILGDTDREEKFITIPLKIEKKTSTWQQK